MMTGLKNRAAFIDDSNRDAHTPGAVSYIMIDANNLKKLMIHLVIKEVMSF